MCRFVGERHRSMLARNTNKGERGAAGFALTAYQFGSKLADPTTRLTTNDYMDFSVGAGTFVAGLLIANPVGVAAVIGIGVGYGIYALWRDNGN